MNARINFASLFPFVAIGSDDIGADTRVTARQSIPMDGNVI